MPAARVHMNSSTPVLPIGHPVGGVIVSQAFV